MRNNPRNLNLVSVDRNEGRWDGAAEALFRLMFGAGTSPNNNYYAQQGS